MVNFEDNDDITVLNRWLNVRGLRRGLGGTLRGGTLGGGGVRWWGGGGLLDVGYVEGVRWEEGVRWGTSTREDRSKTAQILLEKPFKNHRKK